MSKLGANDGKHAIENAVVASVEPIMGKVTNTRSKRFLKAIEEGIESAGDSVKSVFGGHLKSYLLPAQDLAFRNERYDPDLADKVIAKPQHHFSRIEGVKTIRSTLSTYQTDFSDPNTPVNEKKYIIYFNGNGSYAMQSWEEMRTDAATHSCVGINFDYPGCGESTGKSERAKHMVDAGLAQVKRLIEMGVPSENILLKGQSIGGGVATVTAAKLHEQGQKVHLYNQRSFAKTSKTAKYMLGGGVLGKIAAFAIKRAGWEINAIKAWNKIPDAYKDFCFASTDKVIPPKQCGLAGALEKSADRQRRIITGHNGHNEEFYGDDAPKNGNGVKAYELFNQFVRKQFANPSVDLHITEKEQIRELITLMETTPRNSGAKLAFSSNENAVKTALGKNGDEVLSILKLIEKAGKATQHQLSDLENHLQATEAGSKSVVRSFHTTGSQLLGSIKQRQNPRMEPISASRKS
jgi:hypothetical protein